MQKSLTLLLLCSIATTACTAAPHTITPYQARVVDGDTLEILVHGQASERVRLLGIDAPESRQDFGSRSRQSLARCVRTGLDNGTLSIIYHGKDRYGRLLGKVMANGTDCNLAQIKRGLAWHYKAYQTNQTPSDRTAYARAEYTAYQAKVGLWAMCATPPWQYRRGGRACGMPDFNATPNATPSTLTPNHSSGNNTTTNNNNASNSPNNNRQSASNPKKSSCDYMTFIL
ncbi:MAG: thermonuclease family protein [Moraxella sp.]|nr:thermonuclease family protein [Moraxella sp.]